MFVAGRHAVEFIENLTQVLLLYADSVVLDCDLQTGVGDICGRDFYVEGDILAPVFHGVVKQIEYYIREVHFVDVDDGIFGIKRGVKPTAVALHFELEGVYDIVDGYVGVDFLQTYRSLLAVEHRHLQHFLYLEAQTLCLIVDD